VTATAAHFMRSMWGGWSNILREVRSSYMYLVFGSFHHAASTANFISLHGALLLSSWEFSYHYWTQIFMTNVTSAQHWGLSWTNSVRKSTSRINLVNIVENTTGLRSANFMWFMLRPSEPREPDRAVGKRLAEGWTADGSEFESR
jgi:hypothetical protein